MKEIRISKIPFEFRPGTVSIVGAGPGDPDLLTRKGLSRLESADVILYDALLDPKFLEIFPNHALILYVGKRSGEHSATQEEINNLLIQYARANKKVVRLKGGDPFVFGRAGEEILALRNANIEFEIIPGVSSIQSGASDSNIPLTHRNISRQLLVLDGHTIIRDGIDWSWLSKFSGTISLLMGTKTIQEIARRLVEAGVPETTPIAMVTDASLPISQSVFSTLEEVVRSGLSKETKGPGIVYIGESVKIYHESIYNQEISSFSQFRK
ncbi:uroporphyrinogen-III C-methyltransferase [Leptospira sp. GIMC2001]|uniref:uroporphyrinogen-III C-methyltransferase n=1 Tax=Leptospira sp. GIMC2001 TaxID=1513297 RepID=UPI002349B850|nr:uroporphyrinogen-III C-methyltransferase [Leptospira sp. GIMC2001]WCL50930.1 uroporphyrinogen-III C-methyltransferase [Leptospira sp. GIMC2001]